MTARGYVAQVQRLIQEKRELEEENAALREIVEAMTHLPAYHYKDELICFLCHEGAPFPWERSSND